jgi:hypothetical protein
MSFKAGGGGSGVSFRVSNGELVKVTDWVEIKAVDVRHYRSRNGVTVYTTHAWADGTHSCNCPGWANGGGKRDCDHVKRMKRGEPSDVVMTTVEQQYFDRKTAAAKQTTSVVVQPKPTRLIGGEI